MAFPLIPFAAGVAVGSLVTYGYRDPRVRQRVVGAFDDLSGQIQAGVGALLGRFVSSGPVAEQVAEAEGAETLEPGVAGVVRQAEAVAEEIIAAARTSGGQEQ